MSSTDPAPPLDAQLSEWFAASARPVAAGTQAHLSDKFADSFTEEVAGGLRKLRRRRIIARVLLGIVLATVSVPAQDAALAVTEVLMIALLPTDNSLLSQFLAPLNSVAGLLSATILGLKLMHNRIFN